MTLEEILALESTPEAMIAELKKGRLVDLPDIARYENAIKISGHDVFDETKRLNKQIKEDDDRLRVEPVARIGLAMQKLIVKRAVAFIFGNPIELSCSSDDTNDKLIYSAMKDILSDVKIDSLNRRVAKSLFSCTEVAELWYPQPIKDGEEPLYGIDSKYKLRMKILDPLKGEKLYPYFDDYGDMIAFSREYSIEKGGAKSIYLEVYTDKKIYKYDLTNGVDIEEGFPRANVFGKIPVIYGCQEQTDFEDVQGLIDRLEKLLSNFADTNDYHGSPIIFIKGKITGFSKKGESGKIIEGDKDTTAEYLSWTSAPESVQLEINTLISLIHTISQTPDISFDNIKGLGSGISGKALRMMFLDAHLKVEDHMEVFDEYLQRRHSLIKAFIGTAKTTLANQAKKTKITFKVTPYMIDDETDKISMLMTATGNKAVVSQKSAVQLAGLSTDAELEYVQIQNEESAANSLSIFPTAK
jgi:SPP1 family phage portal protein